MLDNSFSSGRLWPYSYSVPFLILLFVLFFFASPLRAAGLPAADELDAVCAEAAARLVDDLGEGTLQKVAVYYILPKGLLPADLNDNLRSEARSVRRAFQDALCRCRELEILNRDNEVWAAVLHQEGNRGTLDGQDIMKVGQGLGARWIIYGEYWQEDDGRFHLRTRLFNGETGHQKTAAHVDNSLFSSHQRNLRPLFYALVAVLVLGAVSGAFFLNRRRHRQRQRHQDEAAAATDRLAVLRDKIKRRRPEILTLPPAELAELSPAEQQFIALLKEKSAGLVLEDSKGRRLLVAPGPEQSLGRGDNWFFAFSDPRISRSGQARLHADGGRCFIVHNPNAANPTLVNCQPVTSQALTAGDEIALGPATRLKVQQEFSSGSLALQVTDGPDVGRGLLFLTTSLPLAEINACFGTAKPADDLAGASLLYNSNHFQLNVERPGRLKLKNPAFPEALVLSEPGSYLLIKGDTLQASGDVPLWTVKGGDNQ